jgi:hypothetical protein
MSTTALSGIDLAPLVERLERLQIEIKAAEAERDLLRREIGRALPPGLSWSRSGGSGVRWSAPRYTFKPVRARIVLEQVRVSTGEDWLTPILVPTPDKEKAQAYVPDTLYQACCQVVAPFITLTSEKS